MSLTRHNLLLLATAGGISALQFLPHWYPASGDGGSFLYGLLVMVAIFLLAIDTFVYCMIWPLSRPDGWQRWRDRLAALGCVFAIVVGVSYANMAYARGLPSGSFLLRFDATAWKKPSSFDYRPGDITERQKMLGDVIRQIVVNGNQHDIIAKLGPSEGDGFFSSSGRDLIYCTGPQRDSPFPIDSEWLLIWFDPNGRTSRYEIWSD